jgi:hypothetical protein
LFFCRFIIQGGIQLLDSNGYTYTDRTCMRGATIANYHALIDEKKNRENNNAGRKEKRKKDGIGRVQGNENERIINKKLMNDAEVEAEIVQHRTMPE